MSSNFLVVYSNDTLKEYLYINSFYAFLGWFVAGKLWITEKVSGDVSNTYTKYEEKADAIILLSGDAPGNAKEVIDIRDYENDERYSIIDKVAEELRNKQLITDSNFELIGWVKDLFVKLDFMKVEYTSKFYFHPDVGSALNKYYDFYNEVYDARNHYHQDLHYVFLRGKIARRIQELHLEEGTDTPFDIPKLVELINQSVKDTGVADDSFDASLRYLRGHLYATDPSTRELYYKELQDLALLHKEKDDEWKSLTNVYLILAKTGVKDGKTTQEISTWLDEAFRIDNNNYRAIYRLAMMDGRNGKLGDEWKKLSRVENILESNRILQPTEIEYFTKANTIKKFLARKEEVINGKANIDLNEQIHVDYSAEKYTAFFRMFFGNSYLEYRNLKDRRIRNYLKREGFGG